MAVFVDTSGILAFLGGRDLNHHEAVEIWRRLIDRNDELVTTSYVLVESAALLARRLGLAAVRSLHMDLRPAFATTWVDEQVYDIGMAMLLAANQRDLSLVDCVSFEVMRQQGIDTAFAFDDNFFQRGFNRPSNA